MSEEIIWQTGMDEALNKAGEQGSPILLDFFNSG